MNFVARLARERQVDAVLVAGDVFDDNGVGADTVQQARDALAEFGAIPVVLLPGNHDPATADSALRRLAPAAENLHLALTQELISIGGTTPPLEIYPCPLVTRHHYDDPAGWLPARGDGAAIRVAVAHGGALSFGETTESPNRIDVAAILARGFDYVALGDWHGVFQVEPRAWYAGAPEATRYKEKQPGYVLIVDIDAPGAEPRVEQVAVARTRWLTQVLDLANDDSLDDLATRLDALEEKSWTLLELTLHGQLSLAGHARLETLLDDYRGRLANLRVDAHGVTAAPTESDLDSLRGEGFLGRAIERLRNGEDPADADALRLLYRMLQEPHS